MNQVESVAFWAAFIASLVGIVLSIVAIVFSILVDRRSSRINEKTIQSLQKIESAVERSSSDTCDLIKAGWDRMLGNVDRTSIPAVSESSAKDMAAGIAAELRSELTALNIGVGGQNTQAEIKIDELDKTLKAFETNLLAQLRPAGKDSPSRSNMEEVMEIIRDLSRPAHAVLLAIRDRHLAQPQYKRLLAGRFSAALLELRKEGLLVPVVHETGRGKVPCYYFPSAIARTARAALQILPEPPDGLKYEVAKELESVGYKPTQDHPVDEV